MPAYYGKKTNINFLHYFQPFTESPKKVIQIKARIFHHELIIYNRKINSTRSRLIEITENVAVNCKQYLLWHNVCKSNIVYRLTLSFLSEIYGLISGKKNLRKVILRKLKRFFFLILSLFLSARRQNFVLTLVKFY